MRPVNQHQTNSIIELYQRCRATVIRHNARYAENCELHWVTTHTCNAEDNIALEKMRI